MKYAKVRLQNLIVVIKLAHVFLPVFFDLIYSPVTFRQNEWELEASSTTDTSTTTISDYAMDECGRVHDLGVDMQQFRMLPLHAPKAIQNG
jgi:hypothetical protein